MTQMSMHTVMLQSKYYTQIAVCSPQCVCLQVRYPPLPQKWTLCLTLHPLHHCHSAQDIVRGTMLGITLGRALHHSMLATELLTDYAGPSSRGCVGVCLSIHYSTCSDEAATGETGQAQCKESAACCTPCSGAAQPLQSPQAKCGGGFSAGMAGVGGSCNVSCAGSIDGTSKMAAWHRCTDCSCRSRAACWHEASTSRAGHVSPAAAAAMQACSKLAPQVGWVVAHVYLDHYKIWHLPIQHGSTACHRDTVGPLGEGAESWEAWGQQALQQPLQEVLLDDEWKALEDASVMVLDVPECEQMSNLEQQCLEECAYQETTLSRSPCFARQQDLVRLTNTSVDVPLEQSLAGVQSMPISKLNLTDLIKVINPVPRCDSALVSGG